MSFVGFIKNAILSLYRGAKQWWICSDTEERCGIAQIFIWQGWRLNLNIGFDIYMDVGFTAL